MKHIIIFYCFCVENCTFFKLIILQIMVGLTADG
jgi:hypothetical protein